MPTDYTGIQNPYGSDLIRVSSPVSSGPGATNSVLATGPSAPGQSDTSGAAPEDANLSPSNESLPVTNDRVWTSGWYKSHNYKPGSQGWLLEGAQGFIDVAELRVGRLGINIVQTATGINSVSAISIENAADASAITVLKTGTGSVAYFRMAIGGGYILDMLQEANAPAVHGVSNNASAPTVVKWEQLVATSTNFGKIEEIYVGATKLERWVANNANPNTVITAPRGSICQSTDGNVYRNTDGSTAWTAM